MVENIRETKGQRDERWRKDPRQVWQWEALGSKDGGAGVLNMNVVKRRHVKFD